ncbi:cytochrome c [bacterium]|nr:cytochrome c [bacterium]
MLAGCKTKSYPVVEYMPDMYHQISLKAQEYDPTAANGVGMRPPVEGTVPRGYEPYPYTFADTILADQMANPLRPTAEILEVGRNYYETYCIVCHGARGDGLGYIVPKFTQPPSLFSEKLLRWPDGRIYHTISLGQGLMSSYATQLLPEQRWAVVHYVRALQRAAHPTEEDLAAAKQSELTLESDLPDTARTKK